MRKILIDQYGFESTSQWYHRRRLEAYKVKKMDDGTVYSCFHEAARCPPTGLMSPRTDPPASCGHSASGAKWRIFSTSPSIKNSLSRWMISIDIAAVGRCR